MKILIIDDSEKNQIKAKRQLENNHELTVVGNYDEGRRLIMNGDFEVVMVDLLMPAGRTSQGEKGQRFIGTEMPVGIFLALLATNGKKIKYVGLITDTNHHDHPASAGLDGLGKMMIDNIPVTFCNNEYCEEEDGKDWAGFLDHIMGVEKVKFGRGMCG